MKELEGALDRLKAMHDKIKSGEVKFKMDIEMPIAWCKVCGETREQDLSYFGHGKCGFTYFPCYHRSEHDRGKPDIWYTEDRIEIPVDKLIEQGA